MRRRPPRSTRTDTLFPYTTLFRSLSVFDAYVESLLASVAGRRSLKVAWDAGNGATGEVLAAVVARLPGVHVLLNERIDGDFPNHHPDPTVPENLQQLQAAVRRPEERRVGKRWCSTGRYRGSPYPLKKKTKNKKR